MVALLVLTPLAACSGGGSSGAAGGQPGAAQRVTIDQSTPEALVYTLLLANANGQTEDVQAAMIANESMNPWAVDDPSEIVYCDDEGVVCDYYPTQKLSNGECPTALSEVQALKDKITVEYEPATDVYGENMRADVDASDTCGFDTFNVDGNWVIVSG
ncbi:MAG: hypothetical protein Q4C85_07350 [Actinomyces sp.]|uniref:hypothetical protein n=1 Tax=Actinomyces sp. TaxID=29317 RepID=UPI0026DCC62B|nr:hypothetical protein [Actinomyces sp.]MDO4243559.1 hypothetical protein [Actinomyces sp.]